jgi:hypothetical protein
VFYKKKGGRDLATRDCDLAVPYFRMLASKDRDQMVEFSWWESRKRGVFV